MSLSGYRQWRERKACTKCGYCRMVKVSVWANSSLPEDQKPRWQKLCRACEMAANARHYARLARMWEDRARETYAKQAKRSQGEIAP